jgi:hypothetical protein
MCGKLSTWLRSNGDSRADHTSLPSSRARGKEEGSLEGKAETQARGSDLIKSQLLLDYITLLQLELHENRGAFLLTFTENTRGFVERSLMTVGAARISRIHWKYHKAFNNGT